MRNGYIRIGSVLIIVFVSAMMDMKARRISNRWIMIGVLVGILLQCFQPLRLNWNEYLWGIAIPFLIGWIPFRMQVLGAGDIKLLMALGGLIGKEDVFYCIFLSFLCGAGISISKLLSLRQFKESLLDVFRYFLKLISLKAIEKYPKEQVECRKISFSVAILWGYIILLGVKFCMNRLLC